MLVLNSHAPPMAPCPPHAPMPPCPHAPLRRRLSFYPAPPVLNLVPNLVPDLVSTPTRPVRVTGQGVTRPGP